MKNVITIKTSMDKYSELIIHPEKASEINLGKRKFAFISFGSQKHYVKIRTTNELSKENILLSRKLMEVLYLPDFPIYEICVDNNEIIIGPYIGLLLSSEDNKLTTSFLNKMMVYVREYSKLHGSIVVFALNKVDPVNRLIEGYCFNPFKNWWQRGTFPYPSSIYRNIGLSKEWKNHFLSIIGDRIFNSRYFNKWDIYQWFSNDPDINSHIPYTILYHSPQDALDLLERFQEIYIKPVLGLRGRGIVRISMENKMFIIKYREKNVNHTVMLESQGKVSEYIQKRFHHGKYLIQQAIDLLEYKGSKIDFRCIVQKNQSNSWICKAIIGRCGARDSIVSNISNGGTAVSTEYILRKVISTSEETCFDLIKKIETIAVEICNKISEYGINCGTLGLDIGIDTQGRLWLIEINNRDPDPSIALDTHNKQLYYSLKTGPLFYAKFLAGFRMDNPQ